MHESLGKWLGPPVIWSLAAHRVAFGLALIVPELLLSGLLLWSNVQQEQERLAHRVGSFAQKVTDDFDREIATAISTLEVLSLSPALTGHDLGSFRVHARQIGRVQSMNIILQDQTGQQIMNTLVPAGMPLPPSALPEASRRAMVAGGIHVSDLFLGVVKKQATFVVSVPIRTGAFAGHALSASMDPALM